MTFLVFGKHEDPEANHPFTAYRNPTNIYKVGWVYEESGDYYVRITFADSIKARNVLFELTVGDEHRVWYVLGGSVSIIVALAAGVGIARRRKPKNTRKNHG